MGANRVRISGGVASRSDRSNQNLRARTFIAALSLISALLIGHLAVGASYARADVGKSRAAGPSPDIVGTSLRSTHPPYPPANCLSHFEIPTEYGWRVFLVWSGGRSCPRIFARPARAEIWMYEGTAAPASGPWTGGRPVAPAARYGGHDRLDGEPSDGKPAAQRPAERWWEKVATVRVNRNGSWSAEIFVEKPGAYTFAAVNSITRRYVLLEVEVRDETARSDGTAGGSSALPPAAAGGPGGPTTDPLRRVGVPAASSALTVGLALGLLLLRRGLRRGWARRQRTS